MLTYLPWPISMRYLLEAKIPVEDSWVEWVGPSLIRKIKIKGQEP